MKYVYVEYIIRYRGFHAEIERSCRDAYFKGYAVINRERTPFLGRTIKEMENVFRYIIDAYLAGQAAASQGENAAAKASTLDIYGDELHDGYDANAYADTAEEGEELANGAFADALYHEYDDLQECYIYDLFDCDSDDASEPLADMHSFDAFAVGLL